MGEQNLEARTEAHINWTFLVWTSYMDCRHWAGLTYRLSRLKPRASEKMGSLITNNEDLFSLHRYFRWKTEHLRTCVPLFCSSLHQYFQWKNTFFCFSNQCDQIAFASHCLNPTLKSVFRSEAIVPCPPPPFFTLPFSKQKQ